MDILKFDELLITQKIPVVIERHWIDILSCDTNNTHQLKHLVVRTCMIHLINFLCLIVVRVKYL